MTIKEAFERAERGESKLKPDFINNLTGLSSPKIWHLLNILASEASCYLEIGTYLGSSLMAALYENSVYATAVDNFCMKPNLRDHFFQNTKDLNFKFIEQDCFTIDPLSLAQTDLYFYDGEHSYDSQYKAISHFLPAMTNEFIYIVDDWNVSDVRKGTYAALTDNFIEILEFEERLNDQMKDKAGYWCGIAIFKLKKV